MTLNPSRIVTIPSCLWICVNLNTRIDSSLSRLDCEHSDAIFIPPRFQQAQSPQVGRIDAERCWSRLDFEFNIPLTDR